VSQSAYALFNGVGKLQGAKEGGNRDLKRWRTVAISTGEMDLETFIATAGRKTKAGQLVRLLNIPLSKAVRFHDHQNGKQHADALKDAYQHNYGAAGRSGLNGWPTTSSRPLILCVSVKPAGAVLFLLTTVNRFTAWPQDLPFWRRRYCWVRLSPDGTRRPAGMRYSTVTTRGCVSSVPVTKSTSRLLNRPRPFLMRMD
jgi:hypothetical protein